MSVDSFDDFLPEQRSPARVERRRRQVRRRWLLNGGAAAFVALVVIIVVNTAGDDGGAPAPAARAISEARRSRRSSTTTTTTTSTGSRRASDSTTSTSLDGSSATSSLPGASSPVPGTPSPTDPPGTGGEVTVSEDPGACRFEADELLDSGHVLNTTAEEVTAEVEVTWVDSTGDLDSSSTLQTVAPGESTAWSVSTPISDPPQGLTCRVALI